MNQFDLAVQDTVYKYKDGVESLSQLMGMSATILRNKACPTNEHHQFSGHQLINLQSITGDNSINEAMRSTEKTIEPDKKSITASMLSIAESFGGVAHEVSSATSDNILTEREKRDCIAQVSMVEEACKQLKDALYSQETGKKIQAVS